MEAWLELQEICNKCHSMKETTELTVDLNNLGRALQSFIEMKELPWKSKASLEKPQPIFWLIEKLSAQGATRACPGISYIF